MKVKWQGIKKNGSTIKKGSFIWVSTWEGGRSRSYVQALVWACCRVEDKNLNICLNEGGALGFIIMLISKRSFLLFESRKKEEQIRILFI
jgi:hypothetical protein